MPLRLCVGHGRERRGVVVYARVHQYTPISTHPTTPTIFTLNGSRRGLETIDPPALDVDGVDARGEVRGEDGELDGAAPGGGPEDGGGVLCGGHADGAGIVLVC